RREAWLAADMANRIAGIQEDAFDPREPSPTLVPVFARLRGVHLARAARAASRIASGVPFNPPPCASSGLPPPRPPKRDVNAAITAFAENSTSAARAATTSAGDDDETRIAACPGLAA